MNLPTKATADGGASSPTHTRNTSHRCHIVTQQLFVFPVPFVLFLPCNIQYHFTHFTMKLVRTRHALLTRISLASPHVNTVLYLFQRCFSCPVSCPKRGKVQEIGLTVVNRSVSYTPVLNQRSFEKSSHPLVCRSEDQTSRQRGALVRSEVFSRSKLVLRVNLRKIRLATLKALQVTQSHTELCANGESPSHSQERERLRL